jgi:hypothetical protein
LNTSKIRDAIAGKQIIEFTYRGYLRIAEPHVYGIKNGKRQLLVYQIGGTSSSGRIPDWRRIEIDAIQGLRTTGQKFSEVRELPSGDAEQDWDTIISKAK